VPWHRVTERGSRGEASAISIFSLARAIRRREHQGIVGQLDQRQVHCSAIRHAGSEALLLLSFRVQERRKIGVNLDGALAALGLRRLKLDARLRML